VLLRPLLSFSFSVPATPEIYTLSLHDALPIFRIGSPWPVGRVFRNQLGGGQYGTGQPGFACLAHCHVFSAYLRRALPVAGWSFVHHETCPQKPAWADDGDLVCRSRPWQPVRRPVVGPIGKARFPGPVFQCSHVHWRCRHNCPVGKPPCTETDGRCEIKNINPIFIAQTI